MKKTNINIKNFLIDTLAYITIITVFNLILNYTYNNTRPIYTYIGAVIFVQLIILLFTKKYKINKLDNNNKTLN